MKIALDPPPWNGKDAIAATWEEGDYRRFALVGRSSVISAQISGSDLLLYPERSSGHKALLMALDLGPA